MGREIRKVPPHWDHPKQNPNENRYGHEGLQPMHNQTFEVRFAEWLADFDRIRAGNLDELERKCYPRGLADWLIDEGAPHDPAYYRPWKDEEATWFQLWETVSEGTPVSPPFASKEELADHLAEHGDNFGASEGRDEGKGARLSLCHGRRMGAVSRGRRRQGDDWRRVRYARRARPMTVCHGCNKPLDAGLFEVRTYHTQCDPQGRVTMLERAIQAFLAHWDSDRRVIDDPVSELRAALAGRPVQMKPAEPA